MEQPIYMQNEDWWTTDDSGHIVLTDKAPEEAVRAYNEDLRNGNLLMIPGAKKGLKGFIK